MHTLRLLRLRKLNEQGFDHAIVAVFCVVVVGVIGAAMVVASHAQTTQWKGVLEEQKLGPLSSSYCLSARGSGTGSTVVLNKCSTSYNKYQVWSLVSVRSATVFGVKNVSEFQLKSAAASNECVNDWQYSKSNGNQMRLYPCKSTDLPSTFVWGVKYGGGVWSHLMANLAASGGPNSNGRAAKCLDDNAWSHAANAKVDIYSCTPQGNQEWFEASAPKSNGSSSSSSGSSSSGSAGATSSAPAMPASAPSGFTRAFGEDFNKTAALGSFTSVYGSEFGEYSGCCSTNKTTQYSAAKVLYAQNGSMFYKLHSEGGTSYAAAPQPWNSKSFTYGQWGASVKLDSTNGKGYKIAFLLWPATNAWSNEVDFPEVDPDFTAPVRAASLNYSPKGSGENGFSSQDNLNTGVYLNDGKYHTFLLTWTPGKIVATEDGKTVATFTGSAVPSQAMRISMQAEGWINQGAVPSGTTDVLEVPYVFINTYN